MCKSGMSCNGCVQLAGMSEPSSFAWNLLIALMMEAVSKSETLVNFYKTIQHNIPEESFHICKLWEPEISTTLFSKCNNFVFNMAMSPDILVCTVSPCCMEYNIPVCCSSPTSPCRYGAVLSLHGPASLLLWLRLLGAWVLGSQGISCVCIIYIYIYIYIYI
jgi:hypothetical protein